MGQDIIDTFQSYVSFLGANPWIDALAIVLVSLLAAYLSNFIVTRVLLRLTSKTRSDLDDKIVAVLHKPIFYSVLLIGIFLSLKRIVPELISAPQIEDAAEAAAAAAKSAAATLKSVGNILQTIAVLTWLLAGLRISTLVLTRMSQQERRFEALQPTSLPVFDIGVKLLLSGIASYFLIVAWELNVSSWMTSAGIVGITLGLAARDTIANLFAGIFILADRPYKVGDFVVLDGGDRGMVTRIGIRSTRILTRDDIEITVPNSNIANGKIINESGGPDVRHRIRIAVGVGYGSDVDQVKECLVNLAKSDPQVSERPEPRVRFRNFGDSSLDFELLCWIDDPVLRGRVKDGLLTEIYKAFNEKRIEIPFPKRDITVHHSSSER